uniref:Nudix hydrolase domain-containing protein n=1 Tax=viral metagenome TaxID=1070528 RepID=A0A6C0KVV5_9ZZZZ
MCNNCGKTGHLFHQCKLPITSYGIILFRTSSKGLQYLMIRRKDSFGFIDFIRGKYLCNNTSQLQKCIDEMSLKEKDNILTESFENLWKSLWGDNSNLQYRNEETISSKKFDVIKNGIYINDNKITLEDIIKNSDTQWSETEWEFPKGRRNFQEKDIECAVREFEEETGYSSKNITIVDNLLPFEEIFIGSNHKSYKHKYFLAYMKETIDSLNNFQKTEVSKLEWKTISECLDAIRPYHLEKKKIISKIDNILKDYRFY